MSPKAKGSFAVYGFAHLCDCGARKFAMADCTALRPENSCQRERRDSRQLCRGGHPFQVSPAVLASTLQMSKLRAYTATPAGAQWPSLTPSSPSPHTTAHKNSFEQ